MPLRTYQLGDHDNTILRKILENQSQVIGGGLSLATTGGGGGAGDVVGPAGATDSAIALFNTTTGKLLKNSDLTYSTPILSVPDAFNVSGVGSISLTAGSTAKSVSLLPSTTGGIGLAVAGNTSARLTMYGQSVAHTPVAATWMTAGNPLGIFYTEGNTGGDTDFLYANAGGTTTGINIIFRRSGGTLDSPSLISSSASVGNIVGSIYDGGAFRNTAALQFLGDGAASANIAPQRIAFLTGQTTSRNERGTFLSTGAFQIGVTSETLAAWGTSGAVFRTATSKTFTDSSSATGTVAAAVFNSFAIPTINATNASVVYTDLANVYIAGDAASAGNASGTNKWGLWNVGKSRFDGAITLSSINTAGLQAYNTTDQTTNVQRFDVLYGGSIAQAGTRTVGTIASTPFYTYAQGASALAIYSRSDLTAGFPFFRQGVYTSATGTTLGSFSSAGTWVSMGNVANTAPSGANVVFSITPTYNQASGNATNTDFLINETGTAYGSGLQSFIDQQIGGTSWYWFGHGNQATTGAFNSSSAIENAVIWAPNFGSQTSTAGWDAFKINVADGSGSGAKNLMRLQVGGTTRLRIANDGTVVASGGLLSAGSATGIGYATGAGGAIAQGTNRTTPVTLNNVTGAITTNNTSLAALALATFTVNNTAVAVGDCVILTIRSGQTNVGTLVYVTAVAAGSFNITVDNTNGVTAETGAIIINFAVIKAVSS